MSHYLNQQWLRIIDAHPEVKELINAVGIIINEIIHHGDCELLNGTYYRQEVYMYVQKNPIHILTDNIMWWRHAGQQYLQCASNGDTAVLHLAITC